MQLAKLIQTVGRTLMALIPASGKGSWPHLELLPGNVLLKDLDQARGQRYPRLAHGCHGERRLAFRQREEVLGEGEACIFNCILLIIYDNHHVDGERDWQGFLPHLGLGAGSSLTHSSNLVSHSGRESERGVTIINLKTDSRYK